MQTNNIIIILLTIIMLIIGLMLINQRGKSKKVIYVCSPLTGEFAFNRAVAIEYSRFVYLEGCIPITPHAYFTLFLDDSVPSQRKDGMEMGLQLLSTCDELWVFGRDKENLSEGMQREVKYAELNGIPIKWFFKG